MKQLRTCGESYRLERIERVPSRPNAAAVAGTAVHVGTETVDHDFRSAAGNEGDRDFLISEGTAKSLTTFDEQIEKHRENGWEPSDYKRFGRATKEKPNGEDVEWFRAVGIPNSIAAYVDWRLNHPELVLADVPDFGPAIEVPFNHYIGDQLVHGFIDRVFTDATHGGYFPLDIKSGAKPKTSEQLGLYAAALSKALGWDIEWGFYLYGLKSGEAKLTAPLRLSIWTDESLGAVYLPATKAIDMGIFMPNPSDSCFFCSVSEHCAFVQALV